MINAKTLKRLMPALEAVKDRDAADFREKRQRVEALRGEIAGLRASMEEAAQALDPSDLASHEAYGRYRAACLARIASIETQLSQAAEVEFAARSKLARSHGSLEGCEMLIKGGEAKKGSPA